MRESTCSHENTRHVATTNDRYCHDCKCIIEVGGVSVVPIPAAEYQARQAANAPTDLDRVKQELGLKEDTHIGHVLMEIDRLKSALGCERERVEQLQKEVENSKLCLDKATDDPMFAYECNRPIRHQGNHTFTYEGRVVASWGRKEASPVLLPANMTLLLGTEPSKKRYAHYLGAPEFYELDQACRAIHEAFDAAEFSGVYLVGSSLKRPDYHDVDVRCILDDGTFRALFPGASTTGGDWMRHAGWALHCSAMSVWLAQRTRLKIDFQFQSMTGANELYDGPEHPRNAIGHAQRVKL